MAQLIKTLQHHRKVIFDKGSFDAWCVFVVEKDGSKKAPFDIDYFTDLKTMATQYPKNKVYNDFVAIYELTTKEINNKVILLIDNIVNTYRKEHQVITEQWFTVLYGGMIAEENKQHAILKKRIKRLGIHQVLIENMLPKIAANFSKGKNWRELNIIMQSKGF